MSGPRIDMDPCSDHDPDVYATAEMEYQELKRQATEDALIWSLLETDALTAREPSDGIYTVHEDDLPHLIDTIRAIAQDDLEARLAVAEATNRVLTELIYELVGDKG